MRAAHNNSVTHKTQVVCLVHEITPPPWKWPLVCSVLTPPFTSSCPWCGWVMKRWVCQARKAPWPSPMEAESSIWCWLIHFPFGSMGVCKTCNIVLWFLSLLICVLLFFMCTMSCVFCSCFVIWFEYYLRDFHANAAPLWIWAMFNIQTGITTYGTYLYSLLVADLVPWDVSTGYYCFLIRKTCPSSPKQSFNCTYSHLFSWLSGFADNIFFVLSLFVYLVYII